MLTTMQGQRSLLLRARRVDPCRGSVRGEKADLNAAGSGVTFTKRNVTVPTFRYLSLTNERTYRGNRKWLLSKDADNSPLD